LCRCAGFSKSGYYKRLQHTERQEITADKVVSLVTGLRYHLPRLDGKKLYSKLFAELQMIGKIGRDKFFDILRLHHLLVKRKRSYSRTTNSYHHFRKYGNLFKTIKLSRPNECWVADITYLRTRQGFVYLFLLTDAYSRKIVGWDVSNSLSIEGGINCLKMALRQRDKSLPLMHHSDRGIQYCATDYVSILKKNGISISMTEENHCYENALAERINGILKDEFLLDATFKDQKQCRKSVAQAINIYNEHRPHWSLSLQTPEKIHACKVA